MIAKLVKGQDVIKMAEMIVVYKCIVPFQIHIKGNGKH